MRIVRGSTVARAIALVASAACTSSPRVSPPPPAFQNPSPMVERSRAHDRLTPRERPGRTDTLTGILPRPVHLFVPAGVHAARAPRLLVHFLGPAFIAVEAAARADSTMVVATVNLTAGSSAYEQPFRDITTWHRLLEAVDSTLYTQTTGSASRGRVYLSAFSAGNGAVRAILADSASAAGIAGVVILDGIHTGYEPARRVLAEGGTLDPTNLQSLLRYARRATRGEVRMLITHSEIFPGTFASTTETANWLIDQVGLARTRTLEWGPLGMQQISRASSGALSVLSFAGNSAPDHVDHLHALPWFLETMLR